MKQCKHCKHCDIMFLRPDDTPTPDDACTRCYEEVEAMKVYMKNKKRPNKPLLREKLNSCATAAFTRLQDTSIFLSLCFVMIAVFPIVVGEALIKKHSVREDVEKWREYWMVYDLTWDGFKRTIRGE